MWMVSLKNQGSFVGDPVTHGADDSQIPLKWAERTYEQLINSPKKEFEVFTNRECDSQHSSFDNPVNAGAFTAGWVVEALGGFTVV